MNRLEYTLTEDDLVQFNMYYSSVSAYSQKRRRKQQVRVPILYLVLALFFIIPRRYEVAVLLAICAVGWFFLFPTWIRSRYRKHYKRHVKEAVGDVLPKPGVLEIQEDGIFSKSYLGDSKFAYSAVDHIVENEGYTYIFIGKGMALALPHDRIRKEDIQSFVDEVDRRRSQPA